MLLTQLYQSNCDFSFFFLLHMNTHIYIYDCLILMNCKMVYFMQAHLSVASNTGYSNYVVLSFDATLIKMMG